VAYNTPFSRGLAFVLEEGKKEEGDRAIRRKHDATALLKVYFHFLTKSS
jgi:hypothetical protein